MATKPPNLDQSWLDKTRYKGAAGANHPVCIVLHATAGREAGDLAVLRGQTSREVSVHLYITKKGIIHHLVSFNRPAWHAGASAWNGHVGLNDESIGIELENLNDGKDPYPEAQLDALDNALAWIDALRGDELAIVTHAAVATPKGRKSDPYRFVELPDFLKYRDHDPDQDDEYDAPKYSKAYWWVLGHVPSANKILFNKRVRGQLQCKNPVMAGRPGEAIYVVHCADEKHLAVQEAFRKYGEYVVSLPSRVPPDNTVRYEGKVL